MNKLPKICGFLAALFIALHAFSVSAEIAPVYIHEETSGNLKFSANVFLPEKQLYEVFKVEKQIWNGDEILALLRPRDYGSWTKEERKLATPDTFYSSSSDDWLRVQDGDVSYSTKIMRSYIEVLGHALPYFSIPNVGPVENSCWDTTHAPSEDVMFEASLDFILPEDAVQQCRAFIQEMGIEQQVALARFDAITYQDLISWSEQMAREDEMYALFLENGKATDICNFDEKLDLYCLTFGIVENGLWVYGPLEQALPLTMENEIAFPQTIQIIYTKEGISSINAQNIVRRASHGKQEEILTFEQAKEKVSSFLSNDLENKYTCLQVYVSYIPIGDYYEDDMEYRPFWNFYMVFDVTYESFPERYYKILRMDAVTGEILW